MIGTIINNYVIERKLGGGGMGDVYYAKHNRVDREVAIKILHSHLFLNESIHNRFKNEANALIKLNHPNIVKIFDYVEQENFACLIMEYINGYTLDEFIEHVSGPMPSAKATSIICSVLDAVQYAHDSNIFHRDIKPANIMISKDGNKVRIMDFGIAKLTDNINLQTTHANTQLGTPFYMSPEQIKGLPYSRMSDIYSLGVTLFEMVTGKCPYLEITNLFELQLKIINEPLPPTAKYYPNVSQRIQNAIGVATEKLPERRFQNCNEFKRFLSETITNPPLVHTSNAKPLLPLKEQTKKKPLPLYTILISVGAMIALIIIFSIFQQSHSGNMLTEPDTKNNLTLIAKAKKDSILQVERKLKMEDSLQKVNLVLRNLQQLNIYVEGKQKSINKKLNDNQLKELRDTISKYDHNISEEDLLLICKDYFRNQVLMPDRKTLETDFWSTVNEIKGGKNPLLCKIPIEEISQIERGTLKFQIIQSNRLSSQTGISVKVTFSITDSDGSSPEDCHLILIYIKSGNSYLLSQYKTQ